MVQTVKRDWLMAGVLILGEQGAQRLTIEALTSQLSVTKGSFYHHFAGFQDYKERLIVFVEEEGTLQIIHAVEGELTPAAKLARLLRITSRGPSALEVAFRAWALQDSQVAAVQQRIDQRRIAYLEALWLAQGTAPAQAIPFARLIYTVYIGSQHVLPPIHGAGLRQLYQEIIRGYGLPTLLEPATGNEESHE